MSKLILLILSISVVACGEDEAIVFEGFEGALNTQFPSLEEAHDNPLTEEGKLLGRMLFYEPNLSRTNTVSCASCHIQEFAFSDPNTVSFGVDSLTGHRQAMALFNLGYTKAGFFWDGREDVLRHQALMPIENEAELDESLSNVIDKLNMEHIYLTQFESTFGEGEIDETKIGLALEQFLISIISKNSRWDQFKRGKIRLTQSELDGAQLYIDKGCENCHSSFNFDSHNKVFFNNGLDSDHEFKDLGRELVTGLVEDRAKFKPPSLRNIAVTAP